MVRFILESTWIVDKQSPPPTAGLQRSDFIQQNGTMPLKLLSVKVLNDFATLEPTN